MRTRLCIGILWCLAVHLCSTASAEQLGRLFFTPAQRNALDAGKQLSSARKPAPSGPPTATLNGIVTRSDGESTVWVNGRAVRKNADSGVSASASASNPAAAQVRLPEAKNAVRLKVGQRFVRSTGRIMEPFEAQAVKGPSSGSDPARGKPAENADGSQDHGGTASTRHRDRERPPSD